MILADYHVHSSFSSDGKATMEQMIEEAIKLGLRQLCFTDHMDYDYPKQSEGYSFQFNVDDYTKKLEELKLAYGSRIEILTGIELGLQPHLKDRLAKLVESYPFDFFIGSSHVVDGFDPYFPEFWVGKNADQGIRAYFQSIVDNCKSFTGFCVYGHIDYIIRYIPGQSGLATKQTYDYRDYQDLLEDVLKILIYHGKGIEINTAGLKYGLEHPHPKLEVLKRYKELGGEIITIGSDAHEPRHLAYSFDKVPKLLSDAGFHYYTIFKQGKPYFEKI